ncbi:response regulator transcription factor [Taibaiella soli]|uniref:DNA-binding response regulator n=1 Tax=Taibaiella soli TaxID=1649169 RepID=A0A2W2AFK2_9BACT|nr:response regulator transcription factor [Taibaiella soli]PZF74081.1 DNA-binding response regulator [Taibaiella soli]
MDSTKSISVAIAEDIPILRRGVCQLISSYDGFKIAVEAGNGRELLDQLNGHGNEIDICLLDINMPEMDGHKTIEVLKSKWPNIKVLVLSMYDDDFNIIRMLKSGANGYVLKNSQPEELRRALSEVYQRGYYHSDLVNGRLFQLLHRKEEVNSAELTDKEVQFLSYCCSELTYKEIAEKMRLSPRTVEGYRDAICEKLSVKSRTGLVMYALRIGVVPYNE